MNYVLGIDQGGSKTQAVIADETGQILGTGKGAGACHSDAGMEAAMSAVSEAVSQACKESGIPLPRIGYVASGLTGVDWADEESLLHGAISRTLEIAPERIQVVNDCIIALRAATASPAGCILCAGTGLNCAVRDGRGRSYAFGFYIPDKDQGGIALSRRALQAVYDAESGMGEATALTAMVLELFSLDSVDDLLRSEVTGKLPWKTRLQLPILVEQAALRGDPVAAEMLTRFGRDEASYAVAALKRFGLDRAPVEVVLSGSVFKCRAPMLLDAVKQTILASAPQAVIIESAWEPVIGAVLLALDACSGAPAEMIQMHIKRDAQRFHMVRKT